jgi:hypothetical protein
MANLISKKHPIAYANQTLTFPIIGEGTFNEDGSLDVDDEKLEEFLHATEPSFDFKVKGAPKKEADVVDEETQETIDAINATTDLNELIELAKEAELPADKLMEWTDKRIKKELIKKLTAKKK